ncbi:ABC transporter permease [Kamptonema cortianum]|jgi:peptide/nickel transport system permease protein|nr:ABC transporter permease [Geitlerinema splendidum]MDK3160575.1 ABC transporter permease [Kamptonema cortianum]
MIKYIIRRLIQAIPTFFGITILSYLLMSAAPGGPVAALTFDPRVTPQQRQRLAEQLGVNDPLPVQYLRWLAGDDWMRWDSDGDGISDGSFLVPLYSSQLDPDGNPIPLPPGQRLGVLRGDFGRSFFYRRDVGGMLGERIGATLELGIAALLLGIAVGVPTGILAAVRKAGWFDNVTRVMAVVFSAIPVFWLGLILILIFGSTLRILPMGGRCPADLGPCPPIYGRLQFLILPTFVLSVGAIAVYSRYMRASMLDVMSQDYMRTALSKGLHNRTVWFRHGARNALIPLATFLGPAITGLLSGAAITETIFSWPGLGRFAVSAVTQQDYPVVMAVVIIGAVSTILGYILSDILYALIDPRIRFD